MPITTNVVRWLHTLNSFFWRVFWVQLTKLKVKNFRSFGGDEETVVRFEKLTTFIGNNSSGKTALIHALLKLFGKGNNSLTRSDFHLPFDKKPDEMDRCELYIEVVFEFPELQDNHGFITYSIPTFFENFVVEDVGKPPYIRIRLEATWERGNSFEGNIDSQIYFVTVSEDSEIEEQHKKRATKAILSNIKCIYVPALRDPNEQLKNASGSILYRILNGINWTEGTVDNIRQKTAELDNLFNNEKGINTLKSAIQQYWNKYHGDNRYNQAALTFNSTDMETILKRVELKFFPTETERDYSVNELGDGLRSLFYLSLVNTLLEIENKALSEIGDNQRSFNIIPPVLTIVAVEEPENHIAPHLLGKVVKNLIDISTKENAQTILTSHSPAIIKRVDCKSIRHFRICNERRSSVIKEIRLPEKESDCFKYVKGAVEAYPELYFAKLVILGEGDSEEYVIKKILASLGRDIDVQGISIVPLGGRHVNHFWKLLKDLDIPHITLLDFDRERQGGGWGRIKYAIEQLIENGFPKEKLLTIEGGADFLNEDLEQIEKLKGYKDKIVNPWIRLLEDNNVYFSYPLDLDFMLLEKYYKEYIDSLDKNEGPRLKINNVTKKIADLSDEDYSSREYQERLTSDIHVTLKQNGGDGRTYSMAQKQLMIWYNYFFLSKSKPVTHMRALEKLDFSKLQLPEPLERLIDAVVKKIEE